MEKSNAIDESWDGVAAYLSELNTTMTNSPPSVRYDLQRILLETVENLMLHQPMDPKILEAIHEIAENMIGGYEEREKIYAGLQRIADDGQTLQNGNGALSEAFEQSTRTDSYLLDRLMVERGPDGELSLTLWGDFVLDYLDAIDAEAREYRMDGCINPFEHDRM